MTIDAAPLQELEQYYAQIDADSNDFMCVYGSSVYGNHLSDIDLFIVSDQPACHNSGFLNQTASFIRDLHLKNGLPVDEEVPYASKLLYSHSEVIAAAALDCFNEDDDKAIVIPKVEKTKAFLSSAAIKQRLALNALTTPNHPIGHDSGNYQRYSQAAAVAILAMGISLSRSQRLSEVNMLESLIVGPEGETGEFFLGYKEHPAVFAHLGELISDHLVLFTAAGLLHKNRQTYTVPPGFNPKRIARQYAFYERI